MWDVRCQRFPYSVNTNSLAFARVWHANPHLAPRQEGMAPMANVLERRQSFLSPWAHETRRAAPDLSDEGIDDTFVLVGGEPDITV